MKIAIDYPALTVGIPQGSRLTKAIWGSECLEVEVPELSHVELQAAISWFQADGRGEQETIYRIGERHFRKAIPSGFLRDNGELEALSSNMPGFIQHQAFLAAIEWKSANIEGDVKEHPVTINNPTSWGSVARTIKNLDPLRQIVVKDENPETRRSFQTHIETILSNLLIVDGTLFEGCAEPVYVVHSFPGHTVIRVETEENATYSRTAIFPLGKFDEARAFAAENTPEGEIYTDNISELEDCGQSIGNDTELRSLVAAARSARDHYVQKYTNTYAPNVMALIEDVPISSITLYRKLSAIVRQYDAIGHADADEVAQTLRDAAADPLASVFTDGGRLPLEAVADLWDDRAVHIPIGVASPRP